MPDVGNGKALHSCHATKNDSPRASEGGVSPYIHLIQQDLVYHLAHEVTIFGECGRGPRHFGAPRRVFAAVLGPASTLKNPCATLLHGRMLRNYQKYIFS